MEIETLSIIDISVMTLRYRRKDKSGQEIADYRYISHLF